MKMDNKMIRLILGAVAAICLLFLPIMSASLGGYGSYSANLFDVGIGAMFEEFAGIMIIVAVLAAAAAIYGALKDKQICFLASAAGAVAALIGAIAMPDPISAGWGLWVAIVACAANVYFSLKD